MNPNANLDDFPGTRPQTPLSWFCEPRQWRMEGTLLRLYTDAPTDFWQRTHYGFQADSGHLLHIPLAGDFTMTTRVTFHPVHQYDQAGLMVRFSPDCWIKTSVEYEPDGPSRLGCVVTNGGYSDWSTQDVSADLRRMTLRIRRVGADFHVESASSADGPWSQMRIAHLSDAETPAVPQCGLYACSPRDTGFFAEFEFLDLKV